jgi:anti-sigma regulatory factor (Ser/Thr protein kinase)
VTSQQLELNFPATFAGFEQAFTELRSSLDARALAAPVRYNIELVFEEIAANIVRYGAAPGSQVTVRLRLEFADRRIVLSFEDDGVPFDPRDYTPAPPATSLQDATLGGLGLKLVRHAADSLEYCRTSNGHNRLTVSLGAYP